jgi:hypothetical protein
MSQITQCDCCSNMAQYIREHIDPEGLTRSTDDPAETLEIFNGCFSDEGGAGLELNDVVEYLDALREGGR